MKKFSYALILVGILGACLYYFSSELIIEKGEAEQLDTWVNFTPQSHFFSISLPSSPQYAKDLIPIPDTNLKRRYDMYASLKLDGTLFLISVITYPEEMKPSLSNEEVLRKSIEELKQNKPDYELKKNLTSRFNGNEAVDFSIENKEFHIEGKAILDKNILYMLTNTSQQGNFDPLEYKYFIESFKLLDKVKEK